MSNYKDRNVSRIILLASLTAGVLDAIAGVIAYFIWYSFNPFQVLKFIASGIYGPSAIDGGAGMITAGLLIHFFIAYVLGTIYFLACSWIGALRKYKILAGLLYGLSIWLIMNLVILPGSNIPKMPFDSGLAIIGIIWHMLLVGLPISFITTSYFSKIESV